MSGVVQYPDGDDFSQVTPVDISIGSSQCTMDLYCIRVYDNDLSAQQMEENWIADTQDGVLMLERYNHNNVRDEYGNVVIAKLPGDLPYFIIECAELPQYKGDKKTCSGQYVDPLNPSKCFTFTGAQIDVQGTSSQYYERKNYKIKYKQGFLLASGSTVAKYQLTEDCIATNVFCYKADVASSEGANNVELCRLYNEASPYKTPVQIANPLVRQCIDGYPIVMFWHDTANGTTSFLGKYNANIDKSAEDCFGFEEGDESWEIRNNTSDRVLWKSDDYTSTILDEDNNLGDFQHIGMVVHTNPVQIIHASFVAGRVVKDTGKGKWQYWGRLKNVDYSSIPDSAGQDTDQTPIPEGSSAFITGNKVNFRTGPGTGYTKLLMLNKGDVVEVLETSNGWAKCQYNGKVGYVSSSYLSTAKVDDTAEPGVHITSAGGKVNIRRGNGTEYSVITSVVPGTILPYVATAVNGWLAVRTGRQVGWVHPDFALTDEPISVD